MAELVYLLSSSPEIRERFLSKYAPKGVGTWTHEQFPHLGALDYSPGTVPHMLCLLDSQGSFMRVDPSRDKNRFNAYSLPGRDGVDTPKDWRRSLESALALGELGDFGYRGIFHESQANAFLDIARTLGFDPREVTLRQP